VKCTLVLDLFRCLLNVDSTVLYNTRFNERVNMKLKYLRYRTARPMSAYYNMSNIPASANTKLPIIHVCIMSDINQWTRFSRVSLRQISLLARAILI